MKQSVLAFLGIVAICGNVEAVVYPDPGVRVELLYGDSNSVTLRMLADEGTELLSVEMRGQDCDVRDVAFECTVEGTCIAEISRPSIGRSSLVFEFMIGGGVVSWAVRYIYINGDRVELVSDQEDLQRRKAAFENKLEEIHGEPIPGENDGIAPIALAVGGFGEEQRVEKVRELLTLSPFVDFDHCKSDVIAEDESQGRPMSVDDDPKVFSRIFGVVSYLFYSDVSPREEYLPARDVKVNIYDLFSMDLVGSVHTNSSGFFTMFYDGSPGFYIFELVYDTEGDDAVSLRPCLNAYGYQCHDKGVLSYSFTFHTYGGNTSIGATINNDNPDSLRKIRAFDAGARARVFFKTVIEDPPGDVVLRWESQWVGLNACGVVIPEVNNDIHLKQNVNCDVNIVEVPIHEYCHVSMWPYTDQNECCYNSELDSSGECTSLLHPGDCYPGSEIHNAYSEGWAYVMPVFVYYDHPLLRGERWLRHLLYNFPSVATIESGNCEEGGGYRRGNLSRFLFDLIDDGPDWSWQVAGAWASDSQEPVKIPFDILWEMGRSLCTTDAFVDSLLACEDLSEEQKDEVRRSAVINGLRDSSEVPTGQDAILWGLSEIDDYLGNSDGVMDPGENVRFKLAVGVSEQSLYATNVSLSSTSNLITFVDNEVSVGNVYYQSGDYFVKATSLDTAEFYLSSSCAVGQKIAIDATIGGYRLIGGWLYYPVSFSRRFQVRCGKYDVVVISDNAELDGLAPLLDSRQFAWVHLDGNCMVGSCPASNPDPEYTDNVSSFNWTKSEALVFYVGPTRDLSALEVVSLGFYSYVGNVLLTFGDDKCGGASPNNLLGLLGVEAMVELGGYLPAAAWQEGRSVFWDGSVVLAPQRESISDELHLAGPRTTCSGLSVGEEEAECIFWVDHSTSPGCKITVLEGLPGSIVGWSNNQDGIDWIAPGAGLPWAQREVASRAGAFLLLDWIDALL